MSEEYTWDYSSRSELGKPVWTLRDAVGAAMQWVDAVEGGWVIYTQNPVVVYPDAEEAKAVCLMLERMGELNG